MKSSVVFLVFTFIFTSDAQLTKGAIIRSYHVETNVYYRFATTYITNDVIYNNIEPDFITFNLTIPDRAMVTNFTMKVNETIYQGYVTTREITKEFSLESATQGHKYGRLISRSTTKNTFIVRERVYGRTFVTFNVTYIELLQRTGGKYTSRIYLTPEHPVDRLSVRAVINEPRTVIKADLLTEDKTFEDGQHGITIKEGKATILEFRQNFTEKLSKKINGMMSLEYFLGSFYDAGDILMSKEYFVHYFSPKLTKPVPKDILFLLDISGSMTNNRKLNQLKIAMRAIIKSLKSYDRYNIMPFSDQTTLYNKKSLESGKNKDDAVEFINQLRASGDTDISKALLGGMEYMNAYSKNSNKSMIFFLTDGHSTSGISDTRRILELIRATNNDNIPIFTIAFGMDADWHLTRSLAAENFGMSRRILTGTSAAREIEEFYKEISPSVMSGINFRYYLNGLHKVNYNIIRQNLQNYYRGSELVITGKLQTSNHVNKYKYLEGRVSGLIQSGNVSLSKKSLQYNSKNDAMIERIWSYLVIENLIRQHELALDSSERKRINTRLQRMALKYNTVTPMTVMLADASMDDYYGEDINSFGSVKPLEINNGESGEKIVLKSDRKPLKPPSRLTSEGGRDPHFVIQSPNVEYPVCFNLKGRSNDIIQLVRDPDSDLKINIQIHKDPVTSGLYITQAGIVCGKFKMVVKRHHIYMNSKTFHWNATKTRVYPDAAVKILGNKQLDIEFSNGLMVHIQNHHRNKNGYYFNIGITHEEKLSPRTSGLLGLFIHNLTSKLPVDHRENTRILKTILNGYSLESKARLVVRVHPVTEKNITCWALPGKGDIMKASVLYRVKNILK